MSLGIWWVSGSDTVPGSNVSSRPDQVWPKITAGQFSEGNPFGPETQTIDGNARAGSQKVAGAIS